MSVAPCFGCLAFFPSESSPRKSTPVFFWRRSGLRCIFQVSLRTATTHTTNHTRSRRGDTVKNSYCGAMFIFQVRQSIRMFLPEYPILSTPVALFSEAADCRSIFFGCSKITDDDIRCTTCVVEQQGTKTRGGVWREEGHGRCSMGREKCGFDGKAKSVKWLNPVFDPAPPIELLFWPSAVCLRFPRRLHFSFRLIFLFLHSFTFSLVVVFRLWLAHVLGFPEALCSSKAE